MAGPRTEKPVEIKPDRELIAVVAGAGVLVVLLSAIFGSLPTTICLGVIVLCTLQGFWRGGAEILVLLAGTILATFLAPSLGKLFEGVISGIAGASGILGRIVSIGTVFVLVVLLVSLVGSAIARRWMADRPRLARSNRRLGGLLGLIEGVLLGMAVLWVPLSLEPIAQVELSAASEAGEPQNSGAKAIAEIAANTKNSFLGGIARATNPVGGSRVFALAQDFAMISRDEAAMQKLLESPVMQQIRDLPSSNEALRLLESDPSLASAIKDGGITAAMLLQVMQSSKVLDVLDHTRILEDVGPLAPEIEQAIVEAKAAIGSHHEESPPTLTQPAKRRAPNGGG